MATRKQLIDDIILRVYASKPSDDIELEDRQVAYWIDITRNSLVQSKLNNQIANKLPIESFYQVREVCKSLTKESEECYDPDCTDYRYFFTTTQEIMPLENDNGIIRVNDNFGRNLIKTNSIDQQYMQEFPYGGITTKRQAYYREEGNKIFVEKSTATTASTYEYDVLYVPMTDTDNVADDDPYPLEEELIEVLLDVVEDRARRQMTGIADMENDIEDPYNEINKNNK